MRYKPDWREQKKKCGACKKLLFPHGGYCNLYRYPPMTLPCSKFKQLTPVVFKDVQNEW